MLTQPQVQRFAHESGIKDLQVVEKEIVQVSNREVPTLTPDDRAQLEISYFKLLPFKPSAIPCLRIEGILAENIRATYQREKPRDIWDLDQFADSTNSSIRTHSSVWITFSNLGVSGPTSDLNSGINSC